MTIAVVIILFSLAALAIVLMALPGRLHGVRATLGVVMMLAVLGAALATTNYRRVASTRDRARADAARAEAQRSLEATRAYVESQRDGAHRFLTEPAPKPDAPYDQAPFDMAERAARAELAARYGVDLPPAPRVLPEAPEPPRTDLTWRIERQRETNNESESWAVAYDNGCVRIEGLTALLDEGIRRIDQHSRNELVQRLTHFYKELTRSHGDLDPELSALRSRVQHMTADQRRALAEASVARALAREGIEIKNPRGRAGLHGDRVTVAPLVVNVETAERSGRRRMIPAAGLLSSVAILAITAAVLRATTRRLHAGRRAPAE
jgi:hypothetical protein